jgi:signal transduction histidine kinase
MRRSLSAALSRNMKNTLRNYTKLWTATVIACFAAVCLGALFLRPSFQLTALSDIVQSLLLFSATLAFVPHAVRSRGRLRVFWSLIATGMGLWFLYQFVWIYFEIWLRVPVPDSCAGDVVLFLHIVPLMAALALRPHITEDEYAARIRRFDFVLMIVWWGYLYVYFVIPWQYVVLADQPYDHNLNFLYLIEKIALLGVLLVSLSHSKGAWKKFYANLFGACAAYAVSSHFANWAIGRHTYYSGSFYDIPLAASMAWLSLAGLWAKAREPQSESRSVAASHGVWLARVGMIATFSLPIFAAWALIDVAIPAPVCHFRVVVTLAAALVMGLMVFVRQRMLDRELLRLLTQSQESLVNLKRLQAQITESEKLASVGHLVGGVAHELNNPITAMLGYSDLLSCTALTDEQKDLAGKISQNARRTRSLVASLLSFAKQRPATIASVDLNGLLRTAIKLSQPQARGLKMELGANLPQGLLLVQADSNQLLQVFVQIIDDALRAVSEHGGHMLSVSAERQNGLVFIGFADPGDTAHTTLQLNQMNVDHHAAQSQPNGNLSRLGLAACQGILRQHQGSLSWNDAGTAIRIEIPVTSAGARSGELPAAAWQPQPSA